ncbi:thiamine biosynthesis lipoprotein [Microbacterium endophyticum]|uniref:FAD:protein FMN transferase n=2 Tax=Microbacterium endophyticum TaxID=1526412 RepID=A0A7W4V115_9MICO|nr:thiamine biosynthesis lipoprotein [Microbacterium endophyticum]NIK37177.1 thiamine biosynthesis lipoprotein [Microbacterium endophyticum]
MIANGEASMWRFAAIGTQWEIETARPLTRDERSAISDLIAEFDLTWSRFRADSAVTLLADGGGVIPLPADADDMLTVYRELTAATAGAVNPLVGHSLAQRGYDARMSLVDSGPAPAPEVWEDILAWNETHLRVSEPGAMIDIGALGKGRLVDLVFAHVVARVDGPVIVDASGDLAVQGTPVRVGLEHPFDSRRVVGVYELHDEALCASATNRRSWGDGLHHVLDARTGIPVRTIAATWAVHPDAMHADAAATALFFDGGPELAAAWGVDWVRMTTDGRVEWSPGGRAEIFR